MSDHIKKGGRGPALLLTAIATVLVTAGISPIASAVNASSVDQAIAEYKEGKFRSALDKFSAEIKKNPNDTSAHYYLGLCYQRTCQRDNAKKEFKWVTAHKADAKPAYLADSAKRLVALSKPPSQDELNCGGGKPVVIDFGATWCAPCQIFHPIFEKTKTEFKDKVVFESIDIDDEAKTKIIDKYQVDSVPTVVMIDKSGKTVYTHNGLLDEKTFVDQVKKLIQ